MDIKQLMMGEAGLINAMLQRNNIRAKVDRRHSVCVETGYLSYALTLAMDERFAKVEALQRELSTVLGNARRRHSLPGDVTVIPVSFPRLALELPHPQPKPLMATNAALTSAKPHTMLTGRSYIEGPQDEYIVFDETPHVLIVGITGAGKSVLLQTMLLSLAANTSPAECRFVLVDLKNEDLVPFEKLPHCLTFAGNRTAALDALRWVWNEKEKRIANRGYKPYRVVLVLDEMAQLAGDSEARNILGDLGSIGRSKDINLIGATQHPTEKGGLGSLLKANFPIRLAGMVSPGLSHVATGRPRTHADLLPGKGAFLRCEGPHVYRFQSYFVDEKNRGDVSTMARQIGRMWKAAPLAPVQDEVSSSQVYAPLAPPVAPVYAPPLHHPLPTQTTLLAPPFPLSDKRPLTAAEGAAVRQLAAEGMSKNALCLHVYGAKSTRYMEWINAALAGEDDSKIIRLPRTGTGSD